MKSSTSSVTVRFDMLKETTSSHHGITLFWIFFLLVPPLPQDNAALGKQLALVAHSCLTVYKRFEVAELQLESLVLPDFPQSVGEFASESFGDFNWVSFGRFFQLLLTHKVNNKQTDRKKMVMKVPVVSAQRQRLLVELLHKHKKR